MANTETTDNTKCWSGQEATETLAHKSLGGMGATTTDLESSLAFSYKMKHTFIMGPSNPTPRSLPERNELRSAQRLVRGYSEQLYSSLKNSKQPTLYQLVTG